MNEGCVILLPKRSLTPGKLGMFIETYQDILTFPIGTYTLIRSNKRIRVARMVYGHTRRRFAICRRRANLEYMKEKELEKLFKALANKRRLAIVKYLKKEREATVGDISESIKLSFKATSKHLGKLIDSDIVEREQRGPQMWYRLASGMNPLAKYISNSLE